MLSSATHQSSQEHTDILQKDDKDKHTVGRDKGHNRKDKQTRLMARKVGHRKDRKD